MNLIPLSKVKHSNIKLKKNDIKTFLENKNVVKINAKEIHNLYKDYPIIFTSNGIFVIRKLIDKTIKLDIKKDYIPQSLTNYPFFLKNDNKRQELYVYIDIDSDLLGNKGKQLFNKNGENSKILKDIIESLNDNYSDEKDTVSLMKLLEEHNLFKNANIIKKSDNSIIANDFKIIDINKLKKLSQEIVYSFERNGIMKFIDCHIKSLKNFDKLV